jgi:hypothetical protein
MRFSKEMFMGIIVLLGIIDVLQKKRKITLDGIDIFVASYVAVLLIVSLIQNTSMV